MSAAWGWWMKRRVEQQPTRVPPSRGARPAREFDIRAVGAAFDFLPPARPARSKKRHPGEKEATTPRARGPAPRLGHGEKEEDWRRRDGRRWRRHRRRGVVGVGRGTDRPSGHLRGGLRVRRARAAPVPHPRLPLRPLRGLVQGCRARGATLFRVPQATSGDETGRGGEPRRAQPRRPGIGSDDARGGARRGGRGDGVQSGGGAPRAALERFLLGRTPRR